MNNNSYLPVIYLFTLHYASKILITKPIHVTGVS